MPILIGAPSTSAAVSELGSTGIYAGIIDNAVLAVLAGQALTFIWTMGAWIVNKYFREQQDKDLEVKRLQGEFQEFREEMAAGLRELKAEMRGMGKLPNEQEIMHRLEQRMEYLVFKAAKELGIKGKQ